MKALGRHIIGDFYGCDRVLIDDASFVQKILLDVVGRSGATIINHTFHKFSPQGVTGVVVIAESHVAIHSWPEHGFLALDIFSCTERINDRFILQEVALAFKAARSECCRLERGHQQGV
jgi:S-adenosylmethionine decarboxylase proenzyme